MIERVVGFGSELAFEALFDYEILEERCVPVIGAGSAQNQARHVAIVQPGGGLTREERSRFGEGSDVEVMIEGALTGGKVRVSHHDGSGGIAAAGEVDRRIGTHGHC